MVTSPIKQDHRQACGVYYFVDFINYYYNYYKATVGLYFIYFEEISVESLIA